MKKWMIAKLIQVLLSMLTPELLTLFADKVLDFAEDYVLGTKSELDDRIILPLCNMLRNTFDIPDNDEIDLSGVP